jgi:succinate dehydrogenase/fumarate reductase flavoprotein subunit
MPDLHPPEYDVIVVGGGGSGLAAAVSAAQHGGSVLLLEKRPALGGTTGIAVGSFTAAGTRLQHQEANPDTPADHAEDAAKFAPAAIEACNHEPLRRFFLERAADTLAWLEGLGLSFYGPSPEPPNRVPRMHNVIPGARAYIAALQLKLQALGGTLQTSADVQRLIRDGDRVAGVEAMVAGRPQTYRARRGVILAAGDYAGNGAMIARFKGEAFSAVEGINPYATGDGHRLAEEAGAQLLNMEITYGPELRFVAPVRKPFDRHLPAGGRWGRLLGAIARRLPAAIMRAYIKGLLVTWQHPEDALFDDGAILINRRSERFTNERQSPARELAVAAQPDKEALLLLDGRLCERYSAWPHFISTAPDIAYAYVADYLRLRPDVATQADTLAAVARRRGLDPGALEQTVAAFNRYARGEAADPFGRTGDASPMEQGPWLLLGPVKAYFTTTEGGAAINQRLQVLDQQGRPIPGLYAVGQNGLGGQILWGHGLHIAWAITSGRLAGQAVMADE